MFKNSIHSKEVIQEIKQFLEAGITENKSLEYKSQLPTTKESVESLLLKPLCAFANTSDGYIIYGISDEAGIIGVAVTNEDDLKLQLENFIRDYTEPQIVGTEIAVHKIDEENNNSLVILKIKKSWYGPHRNKKSNKFYGRNNAGSYSMEIAEIRRAFNLSTDLLNKIQTFIAQRSIDIEARNTIVPLSTGASVVLHVIPLSAYMTDYTNTAIQLHQVKEKWRPKDPRFASWEHKIVLEGLLGKSPKYSSPERYDLLFRNGIIESVAIFNPENSITDKDPKTIISTYVEKMLVESLSEFIDILKILQYQPPFIVHLSYLGIGGYNLAEVFPNNTYRIHPFDRNVIQVSSEVLESFELDITQTMKPLFDLIWNCCGQLESKATCYEKIVPKVSEVEALE